MDPRDLNTTAGPGAGPGTVNMPCPYCEYDLRGSTTSKCPECGREYDAVDASPDAWRARRRDRLFRRLSIVVMVWPLAFVADHLVLDGRLLIGTVDRLSNFWVKMTFFNGFLYISLVAVAYVATRTNMRMARSFGAVVTTALLVIIAGQVALSLATLL